MEVQWKKNVRVICDLAPGDKVTINNWGPDTNGKEFEVEKVEWRGSFCESGFMIKIKGRDKPLDSGWIDKIKSL